MPEASSIYKLSKCRHKPCAWAAGMPPPCRRRCRCSERLSDLPTVTQSGCSRLGFQPLCSFQLMAQPQASHCTLTDSWKAEGSWGAPGVGGREEPAEAAELREGGKRVGGGPPMGQPSQASQLAKSSLTTPVMKKDISAPTPQHPTWECSLRLFPCQLEATPQPLRGRSQACQAILKA